MMIYFIVLALGLLFIYSLRDGLLILQNRRDAARASRDARLENVSANIIPQNEEYCKRFERAS